MAGEKKARGNKRAAASEKKRKKKKGGEIKGNGEAEKLRFRLVRELLGAPVTSTGREV